MPLAAFCRVHSNSKEVSYLLWQNKYSNLKTTGHIKPKFFLRAKLLEQFGSFRIKFTPKKDILGTEFKKTIVKFKISTLNHHFTLTFNKNKVLWSYVTKFAKKGILNTFHKTIVGFTTDTLKYPHVPSLIKKFHQIQNQPT